jgi:disulfide oxidoreductase YuzD
MTSSTTTNNDACWTVGIEPPALWYKHAGRPLTCSFVDMHNIPIEDKWKNIRTWLVYNDTLRPVVSTDQDNEQPIRGFRRSVSTDGTTLNCRLPLSALQ